MLPYPLTSSFNQEAVYEESQTDRIYTKFDIQMQTVLNSAYAAAYGVAVPANSSPAAIVNIIRDKLLTQRQTLSATVNGVNLIPAPAPGVTSTVDAKNGPQPQYCNLTQLTNTTFLMSYRIVANYVESTNPSVANVLSNRWSESTSYDASMYSTRTRNGKYIIRSDNPLQTTADAFRSTFADLGVAQGFIRQTSEYSISPDGLTLTYRVTDKEVFKTPPAPAYEARGSYVETTTRNGHMRYGQCSVWLRGAKNVDQADLIACAVRIVATKLALARVAVVIGPGGAVSYAAIQNSSLNINMYDNVVEFSCTAQMGPRPGGDQRDTFAGLNLPILTTTPLGPQGGSNDTPPKYGLFGTALYYLQAATYQDPRVGGNQLNSSTNQMTTGNQPGQGG